MNTERVRVIHIYIYIHTRDYFPLHLGSNEMLIPSLASISMDTRREGYEE